MQKHIYLLFIILCGSLPVLAATPNRTLPPHTPPRVELALPDNPSVDDLRQVRLFAEPLIPVGRPPSPEENRRLAAILRPHAQRALHDDFSHLEKFIADHPDSPWTPSLLFNLGMDYYHTGFYSKALTALEKAWPLLKDATDPTAKALADRAAGELAMLHGRLGHTGDLAALLASLEGRVIVGSATEKIAGAKQGLWSMQNQPDLAFRCGPLALDRIRAHRDPMLASDLLLYQAHSTTNGYSLAQLARLSLDLGMRYRMAFREKGARLLLPAVIHWKVGHYAALVKEEEGRYLLQDPTFGNNTWISIRSLETEASGFFLVPPEGDLPTGWRLVNDAEGATVWGKGNVSNSDPDSTTPSDQKTDGTNQCSDASSGAASSASGMPVHSVHLMAVSLNIEDIPVGYTPPVGPSILFRITYNQRDAGQPAVFNYSNLGPKWTYNWLAYITDNPSSPSADVDYYTDGGGTLPFTGYNSSSQTYATQLKSQTSLKRTSATSYEMLFPDGSKKIFAQPDSTNTTSRRVFLTQIVDRAGNAATISYDASYRVIAVTDAIGQVTAFTYGYPSDIRKITKVTDPFGRFATLDYDANGRLWRITDCIGLVSQFSYDSGDFIQGLTTPYGTTGFAKYDSGLNRWLEVTHPNGEKERVEFSQSTTVGLSDAEPSGTVPVGMTTYNHYIYYRNSFHWDRKAYAEAAGDYTKARIYHWLHSTDMQSATGVLESEKLPLENRVWYNYDGQPLGLTIGTTSQPKTIGRVLDDGTTQLRRFAYNALGHVTNSVDPLGRRMTYLYSTNAVDLLEARQTTGTNNVVLGKFLYNDQHLPTAFWDVAGQMTTNTYNARGQLLATTNPRNETTSYTYDTNGYLLAVDGPLPGTNDSTRFTYDDVGRVQTITSPDGYTLAYRYDNLDRLTNVAYPDGTFTAFTYDKLDRVKSRDRMGRETLFAYDALRHLTSVQDPLNRVTRFEYCGCGSMSGLIDPMGRRTTWDYDLQGRLAAKTYVDGSRVTYAYETTTSRLISVCDEKGQYKFYDYYADDNRRRVSYPNALVATPTVTFTYDTNYNRMLTMQDGIGLTTWSYYPPGVPGALQVAAVDGPWDNDTVTFQYDALGRVTNRAINGVAQTWTYDALGRTTNVVNALGSFTYAYDGVTPRVRNVAYPNGQTSHYDYLDHLGDHRLQRITHLKPDASLLSRFTYAYNPSGNITNWLQEQGALAENWAIGYDSADQLLTVAATQAGTNTMTWNYAYDPAGNRLFEETNGVRRRFDYNSLNQLVSSSDASATNTVYEWDSENRLTAVNKGSHRSEFVHDGFGRRVTIIDKDDGITSSQCAYLWVGFAVCEERDRSGALALKQFFMQGESLAGLGTRTNYYYTTDHLRSVREEIGSQQTMITRFRYGPFGQVFSSTEGTVFSLGFGGFWRHKASGLNLTIFRPYDCQAAKWLSRDPIQKFGIQTGHHYAYVENNPLNLVDPLGLFGMSYSSDALPVNENMQKTMDCMANCLGRNIKCTSGRDKHAPGDPHMSGDAADLGLKSNPGLNRSDMETCYKQCFGAKSLGLDEDSGTSNHHYHFQDKPGLGGWTGFHNWP